MFKVLLVEDDNHIREVIADYFSEMAKDDITLSLAVDGIEAEGILYEMEFDLVLLDVMLPGVDGFTLCRKIRETNSVPIIFLTAKSREEDVLYGYETGCDDYMTKPFSSAELLAKSRAILKRSKGIIGTNVITCGEISIDLFKYNVTVAGKNVDLAPKEYALLKYLVERKNTVVDREKLLVNLWGYDFEGNDRVVDNHIKKLRKSLGFAGKRIKTVVSRGYKISDL